MIYEAAFGGEFPDEGSGETVVRDFSNVVDLFNQKVKEIEEACWADEPSELFLTGNEFLLRLENRKRKREGMEPLPYAPNFRIELATSKPYKDKRAPKPYHYKNLLAYVHGTYSPTIAWGMEADDLLCIRQQESLEEENTIICSRDKDLRMMEGWHYGWECHNQAAWGPHKVQPLGELHMNEKKKLTGTGLKFFYAQLIMGDSVDTIPGLPRGGPALAYKTLSECETEHELYSAVRGLYETKMGEAWPTYLLEQARLLWMVRELTEEGLPVMWQLKEEENG